MHRFVFAFLLLLCAPSAYAQTQTSFDVQQFQPSPHAESFFSAESGAIARSLDVRAALFLNYGWRPLQLVGSDGLRIAGVVDHRFDANVLGAVSLFDRLSIGVGIPIALYQGATLAGLGAAAQLSPVNFGDLRLSPKVGILDQKRFGVDLAALVTLTFPTGNEGAFAGDRTVTFTPELVVGRRFGPFRAALDLLFTWRERSQLADLSVGPELGYRVGTGFDFAHYRKSTPVEIVGELFGKTSAITPFANIPQSPLEFLLGVKWSILRELVLSGGAGRGIIAGYGSPSLRVFLGLSFSPLMAQEPRAAKAPPSDRDGDGILDENDRCPNEPEDKDGFKDEDGCPEPDNDGDGIPDVKDKCPNDDVEDRDGFEDEDGCFDADNDKDGLFDAIDKCPNVAEDKDGFEDQDGCPELDNDKDGILDTKDKCPNEPEVVNNVDDFDGCPDVGRSFVVVKKESIDILEKVQFETGSATISKKSFGLLDQVASTLKNHEEIKQLRVEGHTDDVGEDTFNLKLSQRRADSVRNYLVKAGVSGERLQSVGYGETRPMAPNGSARGREANRRVAFTILELP